MATPHQKMVEEATAAAQAALANPPPPRPVGAKRPVAVAPSHGVQIGPDQPGPGLKKKPKSGADPLLAGVYQQAQEILSAEQAERDRRRSPQPPRDEDGRRMEDPRPPRPARVRTRRHRPDTTLVVDSQGEPVDLSGLFVRWVRETDHLDRDLAARKMDFQAYGFEPVLDPHTGEPIRSPFGLAMAAPPEGYLDRVLDRSQDGMINVEKLRAGLADEVEAINSLAGGEKVRLVEEKDHGVQRIEESVQRMDDAGLTFKLSDLK